MARLLGSSLRAVAHWAMIGVENVGLKLIHIGGFQLYRRTKHYDPSPVFGVFAFGKLSDKGKQADIEKRGEFKHFQTVFGVPFNSRFVVFITGFVAFSIERDF
ncbi:MAG: hypothetical protein HC904_04980 [Blastochloris sp.]|nr:hypothetical protein [Blastochloris sp.]